MRPNFKLLFLFFWLLCFFNTLGKAEAMQETEKVTNELIRTQLNHLHTQELESRWQDFQNGYGRYFQGQNQVNIFDLLLSKEQKWETKDVIKALFRYFFHEVLSNLDLLGSIVVLTVFSMLLRTLQTAFEEQQVSKVAYAIVFMVIIILAVRSFSIAIDAAKSAIGNMIDVMIALIPLLLTLLASMGNLGSSALFHPLIVFMIHTISNLIYIIIFPLLFFATILSIVSSISEKYKVDHLAGLLRKVSMALLGGLLTIFLGIVSVQGATSSITDGITIRTAKYVTGNFIPIIGRTISDATDTVAGASVLLKNTVGLAGVIILLMLCAFPALKILSLAFIYNFSAAVMQPLGTSPIIDSLSAIGKNLLYIFASLAAVGLMFFLSITIIIASGNISLMMR